MSLLATPFHARAVEANRWNSWENRGDFTLASVYDRFEEEAVAARFGAVLADVSWHWRVKLSGTNAASFVSRFFTRDPSALALGAALDALWLNDGGAVRGAGTVIRLAHDQFLLIAALEDRDWLAAAARLYAVEVDEVTARQGVLALIGPTSHKILTAAGLHAGVLPNTFRRQPWHGLDIGLSRLGLGFEIWCDPDDALIVWDRLMASGPSLIPIGQAALDLLEFECGLRRPGRDYTPSRDGFAPKPMPQDLGLCAQVDRAHLFNGRVGFLAAGRDTNLCGLLLDADTLVANLPVMHQGRVVGRALSSRFSPALQQAIALAILDEPWPAGELTLGGVPCRPVGVPFLPIPSPIGATEIPASTV